MTQQQPGASLAIDAGTSLIKAVIFDASGDEQLVVRRPASISSPRPGWAEQDMREVLATVIACTAEAVDRWNAPIDRVAITAQGDGAWMIDDRGEPVRPAVLWNDGRATDVVDRWTRSGVLDEAFSVNGSLGNLGLPHAIVAWFRKNQPSELSAVRDIVTCGSWLFQSLTGARGLHPSEASAPWMDISSGEYSEELFALFGLQDVRHLVPDMLIGDEQTQPLRASLARATGLPSGIPVTLAPYDVVSTATGSGAVNTGSAFCILGTTLCTGVLTDRIDTGGTPSGLSLVSGYPTSPIRAFPTLAGTEVVEWVRQILGLESTAAVTELAGRSAPGAHGVRVMPYLSPAGERAPFLDPSARGAILGVTTTTTPSDVARATLEGLAHTIRECVHAARADVDELIVSGGGAASTLWCQVIADVTGIRTTRVDGTQIGAKGAMMHAAVAAGLHADLGAAASALVRRAETFEPQSPARDLLDARHEDFLLTRAALADRWAVWSRAETPTA